MVDGIDLPQELRMSDLIKRPKATKLTHHQALSAARKGDRRLNHAICVEEARWHPPVEFSRPCTITRCVFLFALDLKSGIKKI